MTSKFKRNTNGSHHESPYKKTKTSNGGDKSSSNIFIQLVSKSGFILHHGKEGNELECDQAVFQKNLKKHLRHHDNFSAGELFDKLISTLEEYLDEKANLKWALLYTKTVSDCSTSRGAQQDSLVRLLLNIDQIQPSLIRILTENLLTIAYDDESTENMELSRLILANLRWLDHIVDDTELTKKVTDLLQGAPVKIQKEVINVVPDIINDGNYTAITNVLCDLYESKEELVPPVIEVLPYLTVDPMNIERVQHSVLKSIETAGIDHLHLVVKFILHNVGKNDAYPIISDIRENINIVSDKCGSPTKSQRRKLLSQSVRQKKTTKSNEELIDSKLLLFSNIKMAVLVKKFLSNVWLKVIDDIKDASKIREFDLLVMFVFYAALPTKRKLIERCLRNKIRNGLPTDILLLAIFRDHASVIQKYFPSVKSLSGILIRSSGLSVRQYGIAMYKYAFTYLDGYNRQDIILELISHLGDNDIIKSSVLTLILNLAYNQKDLMVKYTIFLKGSLDHIELFKLQDAKKLLNAICYLAFINEDDAGLKDELLIMIRKQLSHSDNVYKRLGVLSAVQSMKNLLINYEPEQITRSTEDDENEAIDEDNPDIKECSELFKLVVKSTNSSHNITALFMDELASTVLKDGVNHTLEKLISSRITDEFCVNFVPDLTDDNSIPNAYEGVPMALQYSLEDDDVSIYLNLGTNVVNAEKQRKDVDNFQHPIITMCPQFRLLRMIESRLHDGNLINIEGLLGCPIYGPTPEFQAKIESLSTLEQGIILSYLFYAINWLRELINAFATQKDPDVKKKVFMRLRLLLDLQKKLTELLPHCPNYIPHLANFNITEEMANSMLLAEIKKATKVTKPKPVKKVKRGKKAVPNESSQTQLPSQPSQVNPTQSPQKEEEKKQLANLNSYRPFLRELHVDAFNLLFKSLELDINSNAEKLLSLPEAEFLLDDFNKKLLHSFEGQSRSLVGRQSGPGQGKDIGFSHLDMFSDVEIAEYTFFYLKPICVHLEKISGLYQELISKNDGVMDASDLYNEDLIPVGKVYTSLFVTMATMVSWQGWQLEKNKEILKNLLTVISKRIASEDVSAYSVEELLNTSFKYVTKFSESILSIRTAISMVEVLEALLKIDIDGNVNNNIVEVVEKLLQRPWYNNEGNEDSGAIYNKSVSKLLQVYIKHTDNRLDRLNHITSECLCKFAEAPSKDYTSDVYRTFCKGTVIVYYSCVLENLVSAVKNDLSEAADDTAKLASWESGISIFDTLVGMLNTSTITIRNMLIPILSYSEGFIEMFLQKAMPVLDRTLLQDHQLVLSLLRTLQKSTRKLQHICTHSKVKADASLMRRVPATKKVLERLVYRVEIMMAKNNCYEAFWCGNLKNRDLQGKEIRNNTSLLEEEEQSEQEQSANDSPDEAEEEDEGDEEVEEDEPLDIEDEQEGDSENTRGGAATDFSVSF